MSRVDEWLQVIANPSHRLSGTSEDDRWLFSMLVHMAFADGNVAEGEYVLLERLLPGMESGALLSAVVEAAAQPFDIEGLAAAFPLPSDRRQLLVLAGEMAWGDSHLDPRETQLLGKLREAL